MKSLTHLCQVNSSTTTLWNILFPIAGCLVSLVLLPCFIEIPVFNANSVDPEQMLCLPIILLGVAQVKWFKPYTAPFFIDLDLQKGTLTGVTLSFFGLPCPNLSTSYFPYFWPSHNEGNYWCLIIKAPPIPSPPPPHNHKPSSLNCVWGRIVFMQQINTPHPLHNPPLSPIAGILKLLDRL